jgi:superfamily II DNA or RNA helicase
VSAPTADLGSRRFAGTFRRAQRIALAAFDRDRADGDQRFYAVLPPGAGKTVVGWEAARRVGRRVLVLAPNTAVQGQWAATWDDSFVADPAERGPACGTDRDLAAPVNVLTYQSIAVIDRGLTSAQRRSVLRDGDREALLGLLHPNGRAVVELAAAHGPWTLVLDECHHLLATWGALVRAIVDTLGQDTALIGLTATPPRELTGWQRTLQTELFGGTDVEIPAPALVKEGELAPYQELVYLTAPTPDEDTWLAAQRSRFADLQVQLVDQRLGTIPLLDWLDRRVVRRGADGVDAPVGWGTFEQAEPDLALAALRFAHAGMIPLPPGARVREQHRVPPDAQDWVAVLADFCQGHLRHSDDPGDVEALAAVKRVLPGLGYRLTVQGLRATTSPVDRLCGLSEAKVAAAAHILDAEHTALGDTLRGLVLCDFEQQQARATGTLAGAPLDENAGSARLVFGTLAAADSGGPGGLRPLLVTGQTFACPAALAADLVASCHAAGHPVTTAPLTPNTVRIVGPAGVPSWVWVRIATDVFTAGHARVLVGTRALLGEGWDCPKVNVTVDLTTAATVTAVTQMRGRSLRRDAADPAKLADNWTVCCVSPGHPKGDADYQRLVRKHDAYFALTPTGEIESGVSHCDPALSPFGPPADQGAITTRALAQAARRDGVFAAWRIGEPFAGVESATVRVRSGRPLGVAARMLPESALRPTLPGARRGSGRVGAVGGGVAGGAAVTAVTVATAGGPVGVGTGVGLAVLGLAALGTGVARGARGLAAAPTALDRLAAVVADALHDADGADHGASAVEVTPAPDGWLRCALTGVPLAQSRRFSTALDELLAPLTEPKHLIGRRIVQAPVRRTARWALTARALVGLPVPGAVAWHAVPQWCGANQRRLGAFLAAWARWIGPARHLTAASPAGAAVLELCRGEDPFAVTTQLRTRWQ